LNWFVFELSNKARGMEIPGFNKKRLKMIGSFEIWPKKLFENNGNRNSLKNFQGSDF